MRFRKDINALRAIAVIAVVIFHFKPQWLTGGFAGVDVFFVISGYLMTAIIINGLTNNNFSTWQFYQARAKRIFPALAALCLVLLIFGWFYLYALDYKELSKHTLNALGFISNIVFARETDYFVQGASEQWLLHTWSLSVEWQFYLIFPLLLLLLFKFLPLKSIHLLLTLLMLLSLSFSIYLSSNEPEQAFYLLPTRAWEMLIGCIAFLNPFQLSQPRKKITQALGLTLILFSYFYLSDTNIWPGYLALLPVLGAYLVIVANNEQSYFSQNSIFQWLGKSSYSIYLWHWPIVVFGTYQSLLHNTYYLMIGILLSVTAGYISFKYIERANFNKLLNLKIKPWYLYVFIILIALVIYKSGGAAVELRTINASEKGQFAYRYELKNYTTTIDYKYRRQCNFMKIDIDETLDPICMKSSRAGGVFLWGDSHAQALVYGLKHTLPESIPFNMLTTSSCGVAIEPTSFGNKKRLAACNRSNQYIKDHLATLKPKVVILAQRQRHDITDFESIAKFILSQGVEKVILVGQTPQWYPSLPNALLRRHWDNTNRYIEDISFDHSVIDINQQLHDKYQHSESLTYISLIEHFCQKKACIMKLNNTNIPLVWDYGHLTNEASLYVTEKLIYPEIKAIFEQSI